MTRCQVCNEVLNHDESTAFQQDFNHAIANDETTPVATCNACEEAELPNEEDMYDHA